jgi:hypothetical protein
MILIETDVISIEISSTIQAVLKQFGGYGAYDNLFTDEAEVQQHQRLEKLFTSTRTAKVSIFFFNSF